MKNKTTIFISRLSILTYIFFISLSLLSCKNFVIAEDPSDDEINTILMRSTFKIEGKAKNSIYPTTGTTTGTAFILGVPTKTNPNKAYNVLVTATHVLDNIDGDKAILYLRKKLEDSFVKFPFEFPIRIENKDLWTRHKEADVSVMYLSSLPPGVDLPKIIPVTWLADDNVFKDVQLHPGDELSCLGYPLGAESNEAGFSILRSGKIASFPLTPSEKIKNILFDFEVFEGNSGGPVYFTQTGRVYKGQSNIGVTNRFIVGIVSEQHFLIQKNSTLDEERLKKYPLKLAIVVPASFIKQTIDILPPLD